MLLAEKLSSWEKEILPLKPFIVPQEVFQGWKEKSSLKTTGKQPLRRVHLGKSLRLNCVWIFFAFKWSIKPKSWTFFYLEKRFSKEFIAKSRIKSGWQLFNDFSLLERLRNDVTFIFSCFGQKVSWHYVTRGTNHPKWDNHEKNIHFASSYVRLQQFHSSASRKAENRACGVWDWSDTKRLVAQSPTMNLWKIIENKFSFFSRSFVHSLCDIHVLFFKATSWKI